MRPPFFIPALAAALFAACSTAPLPPFAPNAPRLNQALDDLRLARRRSLPAEERAAHYLSAAEAAEPLLDDPASRARPIYNLASAELTDLLRSADGGRLWNHPLTVHDGTAYQLRFAAGARGALWSPTAFTDFKVADRVPWKHLRRDFAAAGVGGTLVGIQQSAGSDAARRARFEPKGGFVAPVTATLDFRGHEAALALRDPAHSPTVQLGGRTLPLAADFSAPIASLPVRNEFVNGLLGMVRVEKYLSDTGLYFLEPYDPDRVPVILVHGLLSTPQMWRNVINELDADPELRGRVQFGVFMYPTGNPVLYSALRCREELTRFHQQHPGTGVVLVGHSMGGLLARLQVTEPGRTFWDASFKQHADALLARVPADSVIRRGLIFHTDPRVRRVVFIATPHRGSGLVLGSIGAIGMRLITLPTTLVTEVTRSLGNALEFVGGQTQMPNGINSLSPHNPIIVAMDGMPIRAPHHSIIGDRGRGDTPQSSDGVVSYWSSHLTSAESELIVPGPHSCYELPQTVAEVKRILREQLAAKGH